MESEGDAIPPKPTYHFVGEEPITDAAAWLTDGEDVRPLVEQLLVSMPRELRWEEAETSEWRTIATRWHADFIEMLLEGDAPGLSDYLRNLHRNWLLRGIDQSQAEYERLRTSEEHRLWFLLETKSLLVRLAEAMGLLPVEMGPRHRAPENIYLPVGELVRMIETHLDIDIAPPPVGDGRFGLSVGENRVITNRDIYALYLAVRIRDILLAHEFDLRTAQVAEIGGGMGRLAYYARTLGIENLTMIDLPQISFVQAYFLRRAIGGSVRYGTEAESASSGIRVLSGMESFTAHADDFFDLVLNTDSLPEMGWAVAEGYIRAIETKCDGWFLSVNQESRKLVSESSTETHAVVADVVRLVGGFVRVYRFPFWLRRQYVEECYLRS